MAKKILLVGSFSSNPNIYMYTDSFFSSLGKLGFTVEKFNYRKQLFPIAYINKKLVNYALAQTVKRSKPDIVFVIKGETLTPKTLRALKKFSSCIIINFYPDNPFTVWNGNSNHNVLLSLPLYDHFLSWSQTLIPALEGAGCNRISFFPFAFDQDLFIPAKIDSIQTYTFDICFIGTWEPDREQWLSGLIKKMPHLQIGLWGNRWKQHCKCPFLKKIIQGNAIYSNEMMSVFLQSKIVLNLIRKQNNTSHNMRSTEIPATGAFQLSQRTQEVSTILFKEGESVACFSTLEELCKKIDFYLNNEQARTMVIEKSTQQVQQFTLEYQLKKFFQNNNFLP